MRHDPFADLFKGMIDEAAKGPKMTHSQMRDRLMELAPHYLSPLPFKLGQVVTPRRDAAIAGQGEPQVVIGINPDADHDFDGERGGNGFGRRYDVRVLAFHGETITAFWVESGDLEPYPA